MVAVAHSERDDMSIHGHGRHFIPRTFEMLVSIMNRKRTQNNVNGAVATDISAERGCQIKDDISSIGLLICLYVMQGIPLGLTTAFSFILQADVNTASYNTQATFSIATWPFSMKLLWAPLVDSIYSSRFGRRKSWLIPVQFAIGIGLILLANRVDVWLGRETENPWGALGVTNPVDINGLTISFFCLTLLAATQDIAVDGWALTMLSKRNVTWASTCNTVGQPLGYVIAFILIIFLESSSIANTYFRTTPIEGEGLVSVSGVLFYSGILFLVFTTIIAVLKHEESSTVTKPVRDCMNRVASKLVNLKVKRRSTTTASRTQDKRNKHQTDIESNEYKRSAFLEEENTACSETSKNEYTSDGAVDFRPTLTCRSSQDVTPSFVESQQPLDCDERTANIIPVYLSDDGKSDANDDENHGLSLCDTYRVSIGVLSLRPVLTYIGFIFLIMFCFASSTTPTTLKLLEHGVPKEHLAMISIILLPIQALMPLFFTRWSNGPRPLGMFSRAAIVRLMILILVIPLIWYTPYFGTLIPPKEDLTNPLNVTGTNSSTSDNAADSNQPKFSFSWTFYAILLAYSSINTAFSTFMSVNQIAFHARISDPAVGGTYMTLLNTAANLSTYLPLTIFLALIDPLSIRHCTDPDPLEAGMAQWNHTLSAASRDGSYEIPNENGLRILAESWLSTEATCEKPNGIKACNLVGGQCVTRMDGFYLQVGFAFLIGLFTFPTLARRLSRKLDELSLSAYSFRLSNGFPCFRSLRSRSCCPGTSNNALTPAFSPSSNGDGAVQMDNRSE